MPAAKKYLSRPVKSETPKYEGKVVLKMGMFPRIPPPEFETFSEHRHPWQGHNEGVVEYRIAKGGPTM